MNRQAPIMVVLLCSLAAEHACNHSPGEGLEGRGARLSRRPACALMAIK